MGTVHQLRWDRPRGRSLARPPRKFLARRSDALFFFGIVIVAAAIGANALGVWHAPDSTRLMGSVQVVDGDSLKAGDEQIRLIGIDAPSFAKPVVTRRATDGNADGQPERGSPSSFPKATLCAPRTVKIAMAARSPSVPPAIFLMSAKCSCARATRSTSH